jgi:hypothetical protein
MFMSTEADGALVFFSVVVFRVEVISVASSMKGKFDESWYGLHGWEVDEST